MRRCTNASCSHRATPHTIDVCGWPQNAGEPQLTDAEKTALVAQLRKAVPIKRGCAAFALASGMGNRCGACGYPESEHDE